MKADFGLDSFVLRDFWATEAALGGDDAGLPLDERVSSRRDAPKRASHAGHAASQGAGSGGLLE